MSLHILLALIPLKRVIILRDYIAKDSSWFCEVGSGRLGDKKKLTSKSHPILEPNIGTCSRAI